MEGERPHAERETCHYLTSLEKLERHDVDVFIGAHPGQNDTLEKRERMTGGGNPFIDRKAWPTFLSQLKTKAKNAFGTAGEGIRLRCSRREQA
jgi:hypothetical protein